MSPETENYSRLSEFFRDEYHALKGYVRSRIDDTAERDAEDIIQEVALRIFSRARDLTPISNIAGFVYHAVRNRIIDTWRSRKGRSDDPDALETQWTEFAGLFYDNGEPYPEDLIVGLQEAIASLRPEYRAVVLAVDFDGYTYRELSDQTGISPGTLMSRRHRALSELNRKLKLKK